MPQQQWVVMTGKLKRMVVFVGPKAIDILRPSRTMHETNSAKRSHHLTRDSALSRYRIRLLHCFA
jgi:hypothetical protein